MVFPTLFFCAFFGLYAVVLLVLLWPRRMPAALPNRPLVSILIAARNEEATIERCLGSLASLNYPAEQLEILIGDDASTDATMAVVQAFIADKPQFRLLPIRQRLGTARGKSNVLAHLCRAATADYFLITDADMALPPDWVQTMLGAAVGSVGVVTGVTTATGGLFGRLQGLDWLFGLSVIQLFTEVGLPVTAVGNNMLVTRAAYESIGGYEALAFSITEDLQLFGQIVSRGWGFRNLVDARVLGISVPQPSWLHLLRQRKRWMKGTVRLPWYLTALFCFNGAFYAVVGWPFLLPLSTIAVLYGARIACQALFLLITLRQAGHRESLGLLLLYELYMPIMSLAVVAYTLWPSHIQWKERSYRWAEG